MLIGVLCTALLSAPQAHAQVIDDHPAFIVLVAVGTLGGLANTIGAIIYAVRNRSFDSGWVVPILLSSAICASFAGAIIADMAGSEPTGIGVGATIGYLAISLWPAGWLLRSSLSDVEPGERLDPPLPPPSASNASASLGNGATLFSLGRIRF